MADSCVTQIAQERPEARACLSDGLKAYWIWLGAKFFVDSCSPACLAFASASASWTLREIRLRDAVVANPGMQRHCDRISRIVEDRISQAPHRGRFGRRTGLACERPRDFDRNAFDRVVRVRLADQAIPVRRTMNDEEPLGDISGRLIIKSPHRLAAQLVVLDGMGRLVHDGPLFEGYVRI